VAHTKRDKAKLITRIRRIKGQVESIERALSEEVTGEERLREFVGELYQLVNIYEGRPTDSQVARTNVLARELDDLIRDFTNLTDRELPAINRQLQAQKLTAITVVSEQDWRKSHAEEAPAAGSAARSIRERE
jgi:Metal-sensitive transcriptional repressor